MVHTDIEGDATPDVSFVEQPADDGEVPQTQPARMAPVLWVILTFCGAVGLVSLFFWPGQMDSDTLDAVNMAATGHYDDFHAPLLSALWRLPYILGVRSLGWVMVASVFTLLVGLYLVLRVRFGRAISTVGALACLAWPPVLSWAIHDGRDAWFAALFVAAFGFAARLVRMGDRQRRFNLVACVAFGALAAVSWQIVLVPLFVLALVLAGHLLPGGMRRRRLATIGIALAACVGLYGLQLGILAALDARATYTQQGTFIYDLAQLSKSEGKNLFPAEVRLPGKPTLSVLQHQVQVGTFDTLVFGNGRIVRFLIDGQQENALQHAWFNAIVHNPWGYLHERSELALAQLSVTKPSYWTFQLPPDNAQNLPLSRALQTDGLNYLGNFSTGGPIYGGVLYDAWIYGLIVIGSIPILLLRRQGADRVIAAMSIAMVAFVLTLFFTAPSVYYRFVFPVVLTGTVTLLVLVPRRGPAPAGDPD